MKLANEKESPDQKTILPADQFEYIADLLKELRAMALSLDADVLAHVIEVAMLEALLQCEIETGTNVRHS